MPINEAIKKKSLYESFLWFIFQVLPTNVGVFHSPTNNSKIYRLHERWVRIINNDTQSSFKELLEKDNSQKQSSGGILQKKGSWKLRKIRRKTPVQETLFQ